MNSTSGQPVSYLMINKEFEKPVSFSPTLARVFGIEAAIFLQWLHYFMVVKSLQERPTHDGRMWVYNSYEDWHSHMTFLSLTGMTSAIRKMETLGVILSAQLGVNRFDRRKSYTIDYERLADLTGIPRHAIFAQNGLMEVAAPTLKPTPVAVTAPVAPAPIISTPNQPANVAAPIVEEQVNLQPASSIPAPIVVEPAVEVAAEIMAEPAVESVVEKAAESPTTPMPAECRVLVQRNRRLKSLNEATPEDFERLGLPDLRHIEAGLRPFSYSPVVLGICPVPSDYYAHVEEVCLRLNVPYVRPDIEPHVVVASYTDSNTNLTKTNSSPNASADFSAVASPTLPQPSPVADATEKGFIQIEGDLATDDMGNQMADEAVKTPRPLATTDSIMAALCMVCYPGGEVNTQRKSYKIERELNRAAQDILSQMPDVQPDNFRLWPAFQQVMGWRYLTPGFVVQHWAEYRTYCENPSRFVVRLPNRAKKPDPFTHLRDEFVLDIPED